MEIRESKTAPKAYAQMERNTVQGSRFDYGNSGGCMKTMRFAAVVCVVCLGLVMLSGCGGSSSMISIQVNSVTGILMMDQTPLGSATPNTLNFTATAN